MQKLPQSVSKWKLTTLILIVALVFVSFIALVKIQGGVSSQPNFLNVFVSPDSASIGVNKPTTFTASVSNAHSNNLEYSWSVSPSDNKTSLLPMGKTCNLTFLTATTDRYVISVQIKDLAIGNLGSGSATVYDPYTSPTQYLGAVGLPYSYLIQTDGLGWYRAINGADSSVSFTSTNGGSTLQSCANALTIGGTIYLGTTELTTTQKITVTHDHTNIIGETYSGRGDGAPEVNGTEIRAVTGFSATDDLLYIADGVSYCTFENLKLNLNGITTGSALHIYTPVSVALSHAGITLDNVYILGNDASSNYALQVDSLGFSHWGTVRIENFKNGLQWQAVNQPTNGYFGNSKIDFLYITPYTSGIDGTNIRFERLGFMDINLISSTGSSTAIGTGLIIDECADMSIDNLDLENFNYGVIFQNTAGGAVTQCNDIKLGYIAAKYAVTLTGNSIENVFQDVILDPAGSSGGIGVNDQSTTNAGYFNIIKGGEMKTFTSPYSVANNKLRFIEVPGVNFKGPAVNQVAAPHNNTWQTNPYPFDVNIYVWGLGFSDIKVSHVSGRIIWAVGGQGYPEGGCDGITIPLAVGEDWMWEGNATGTASISTVWIGS